MRRLAVAAVLGLFVLPAGAQSPDWHRYQPMEVGNEWQYGRSLTLSYYNSTSSYYWINTQRVIASFDSVGVTWFAVRDSIGSGFPAGTQRPRTFRVRYDAALRGVIDPGSNPGFCIVGACSLDTRVGAGAIALPADAYFLGLSSGGKRYSTDGSLVDVVDGVGMIRRTTSTASQTLVYARVGTQTFGTSRTVNAESSTGSGALTLFPSVTRTSATLRLPVAATVEAFDALGRRVLRLEAQAGDVTLDVSAWVPGLYWVRAGGETRRLVVR